MNITATETFLNASIGQQQDIINRAIAGHISMADKIIGIQKVEEFSGLNRFLIYSIPNAPTEQREAEIYADCIRALGERPVEPACSNENAEGWCEITLWQNSVIERLIKIAARNTR